ncbi:ADP-ribosylation factor-like 10 [Triplophysa dalaica]|uniref:ADP-ribosylation factor-like 10 n=1 Tax=Triplophysa dalaica TaxID=1582913 RepID=UPI0024E00278|nr:ADP-ribosylation factor-like 10 [Triplophysa dalaica]
MLGRYAAAGMDGSRHTVSFMVVLRHISVALSAAMAAVGTALFLTLNLFYKRRMWTLESEYYTISEEQEERSEKQVLVLGLDGAGKSSVLQGLSGARRCCRPTRGFNFISLHTPACQLDFLEIGGGEDLRKYWEDYLKRTHILVYVVDSSDRGRLPQAKDELHRLLKAGMDLPGGVLGNKQDKPNVCSVPELREALSLNSVDHQKKIFLLGSDGLSKTSSHQKLQDLLLTLV